MKKICFVIGSLSLGGAERMVANLANSFSKIDDLDVSILLFENKVDYQLEKNVQIHFLNYKKNKFSKALNLRKKILAIKPDLIVCFLEHVCKGTMLALSFTKYHKKVITTVRNNPMYSFYTYRYNYSYLKKSKKVIFQNYGERNCFPKLKDENCIIIPNYYNKIFENQNRVYRSKINTIVSVGRLEKQKNYKLLIDSFKLANTSDIQLKIVGKGSQKQELLDYIKINNLENKIEIIDWTKDVKKILDDADLFVMTSKYEGMPNALLEAMVSGIPCISTDCDFGPNEIISNNITGILVENENISDLVQKINYAIDNYDVMIKMGQRASIETKKNFSEEKVFELWKNIICK